MKLGKNQKLILALLKQNKIIDIKDINFDNYSVTDKTRFIQQLKNRELVEIKENKIIYKTNLEPIYDFSILSHRRDFFKRIHNMRMFRNLDNNTIIIECLGIWLKYFDYCWNNNKSIQLIKKQSIKHYNKLYYSLTENIKIKIEETKKRIFYWSNKLYQLDYQINDRKIEKLYLVDVKKRIKFRLEKSMLINKNIDIVDDDYIDTSEVITECIYMIYQLIKDLKAFALSSKLNYSLM